MTSQMAVGGPTETDNSTRNALIGAGVGAVAGGTIGYNKPLYSNIGEIVEEATKNDAFELKTVAENVTGDAKAVLDTAKEAVSNYKGNSSALKGIFTEGTATAPLEQVLTTLNLTRSEAPDIAAANVANYIKNAGGQIIESISADDAKKVLGNYGNGSTETFMQIANSFKGTEENANKYMTDLLDGAISKVAKNSVADTLAEQATGEEGAKVVTKEAAEAAAKAKAIMTEGLEKFSEHTKALFGKAGFSWKAAKWAGIGLVAAGAVAWVGTKIFGGKKEEVA